MRDKTTAEKTIEGIGNILLIVVLCGLFYFVSFKIDALEQVLKDNYPNWAFYLIIFIFGIGTITMLAGEIITSIFYETTELTLKITEIKSKYRAIRTKKNKRQVNRDMRYEIRKTKLLFKQQKIEKEYKERNEKDKIEEKYK